MIYRLEVRRANDDTFIIDAYLRDQNKMEFPGKLTYTAKNESELTSVIKKLTPDMVPEDDDAEFALAFKEGTSKEG